MGNVRDSMRLQQTESTLTSYPDSFLSSSSSSFSFLHLKTATPPNTHVCRTDRCHHCRRRQGTVRGKYSVSCSRIYHPCLGSSLPQLHSFSKSRGSHPVCCSSHPRPTLPRQSLTHPDTWRLRAKERTLRCEWCLVL